MVAYTQPKPRGTKQPIGLVVLSNYLPELCGIDEPNIAYVSMLYDKVLAGMLNEVRVGIITIYHYDLRLHFTETLIP